MAEPVNKSQLFATLAKFYREALRRDKAGRALAQSFGLDGQVLEQFNVGYGNGAVLRAIPSKGGARDVLVESGLITKDGKEAVTGCLIVPAFDRQESAAGFIAISKDGIETLYPAALSRLGVNLTAFAEKEIVFTASVLEAMKYMQAGVNAVPAGLEFNGEEKAFITKHRPDKAYFAADLPELIQVLQKLQVPCYKISLAFPASAAQVEQALKASEPIGDKIGPDAVVRVTDELVRFECGARKYEVKELAPGEANRLRVRVQARNGEMFHLDSIDLYAGRSRSSFTRSAAPLFGVSEAAIEGDLCLMIRKLEAIRTMRKRRADEETGYAMTADEEAEALEYLKKPDILERIVKDLETAGYVGEEVNKKIGYLITISRKLDALAGRAQEVTFPASRASFNSAGASERSACQPRKRRAKGDAASIRCSIPCCTRSVSGAGGGRPADAAKEGIFPLGVAGHNLRGRKFYGFGYEALVNDKFMTIEEKSKGIRNKINEFGACGSLHDPASGVSGQFRIRIYNFSGGGKN